MSAAESTESTTEIEVDPERVEEWLTADKEPAGARPAGDQTKQTEQVQLIDVREQYEREAGHIADSRHIPLTELTSQAASVERERPVVFYCRVGARSDMAAQAFRAAGYEAYSMRGGLVRWAQEHRPMQPEDGYVADH